MHWTDRVSYDGEVYLTLDHTGTWTAQVPQAFHLKALWDQELQHTKTGRIDLEENCNRLMRALNLSNEESGMFSFLGDFGKKFDDQALSAVVYNVCTLLFKYDNMPAADIVGLCCGHEL